MNRIVTPDGMVPQDDGSSRPPTLEERVHTALDLWQYKRKDEGFATALNCIVYLSSGLAGMAKLTQQLENAVGVLSRGMEHMSKENAQLKERIAALEAKAT